MMRSDELWPKQMDASFGPNGEKGELVQLYNVLKYAYASPGAAAIAIMAGPRNTWPTQNSAAGSSKPRSW